MKRLRDYQPTEDELYYLFDDRSGKALVEFEKAPLGDDEKECIAYLLFRRGQREECRDMLGSIEDEAFRRECLEERLPLWSKHARGAM